MSAFIIKNITGPDEYRSDRVALLEAGELDGEFFPASLQFSNGDNRREVYAEIEVQELIDGLVELGLVEQKQ